MKTQQQGMAIIMALLIVALAATAASTVLWQQSLWWRQADNDRARAEIRLIADAGVGWAGDILAFDARSSGAVDYPGELWAQPLPQTEAESTRISGQLYDAQGRFNVHNLLLPDGKENEAQVQLYRRLLAQLQLPPALADTLLDWLDADDEQRPQGAEAAWYAAQQPPYAIPPAASLQKLAQLRWVKGYDSQVLARLAPHLALLPQRSALNVNTISLPLMMALVPGLGLGQAQALINQRTTTYFKDKADFGLRLTGGLVPLAVAYGVRSDYFLLQSEIRHPRSMLRVDALLLRNEQASKVLWREEGVVPVTPATNGES
jgi:general secretion pathway protein K